MPAPARRRSASTSPTATASTSRPMPAAPGAHVGLKNSKFIGRICIHPTESRPRLCRGAGRRLRPEQRARRLSLQGRRQELAADPPSQRRGGRDRSHHGPHQSAHPVRLDVGGAAQLLEHIERRPGQRPVPQHRRRRHLGGDLAQARPARRACWARSACRSRPRAPGRVWALVEAEGDKTGLYRSDDFGMRWTHGLAQPRPDAPALVLHPRLRRSAATPTPSTSPTCRCGSRPTAARASTRSRRRHGDNHDLWIDPNDTTRMIEGNDGGAHVSFNGGALVVDDLQPEDRAVLSHRHRQPVSLPRLRHAAGQHLDLGAERLGMGRDHPGRLLLSRHRRERASSPSIRATTTSSMSAPSARARAAPARCSATTTARARSSWSMCGPRNRPASRPRTSSTASPGPSRSCSRRTIPARSMSAATACSAPATRA